MQSKAVDDIIINEVTLSVRGMYGDRDVPGITVQKEYTPLIIACMYVFQFFTTKREFYRLFLSFFYLFSLPYFTRLLDQSSFSLSVSACLSVYMSF